MTRTATIALAASALLLTGALPVASASLLDRVTVYGFEVRQSHGTELRQHVIADKSQVAPDDPMSVIAENPICRVMTREGQPSVEVTSARVRFYFRGWERTPPEGQAPPELELDTIRAWNDELANQDGLPRLSDVSRGDFLFSSNPGQDKVRVDLGERGELLAEHLFWSEQYQRFIALGGFNQRTVNERGDRIITSGIVFTADEDFESISYKVVGDETIEIEIE